MPSATRHRPPLFPQRFAVVAASVVPFVAFAVGIASGSSWSTWH